METVRKPNQTFAFRFCVRTCHRINPSLKMCGFDYDLKMREMEDGEVIAVLFTFYLQTVE